MMHPRPELLFQPSRHLNDVIQGRRRVTSLNDEAMAAGGGEGRAATGRTENSLLASHSCQSKLCGGAEQYGIQHPSDGGGRGGQRETERGRAEFLRTPWNQRRIIT